MMIAFDIAILKATLNVNWKPLILSAVSRLEKLISTWRPDLALNPGPLRWKRACYRSATVARQPWSKPELNPWLQLKLAEHVAVCQYKAEW